jgi:hypothetical protein
MNSRISAGSTVVDCRLRQRLSPVHNVGKQNREEKPATESNCPLDSY